MFWYNDKPVNGPVNRIICLVPSLTELLFDLGLADRIIGITKFCIHPIDKVIGKPIIGGTKNPNIELITSLHPDLIITNKEENKLEDIEALSDLCPILVTDIHNFNESLQCITAFGNILNKKAEAENIIIELSKIDSQCSSLPLARACYLIWKKPYMTIGRDTYIHSMLEKLGFENVYADESRYPMCTKSEIEARKPDFILLSSEPYPFKNADKIDFEPSKAIIVDGELFSWYGSRLIHKKAYISHLFQQIKCQAR